MTRKTQQEHILVARVRARSEVIMLVPVVSALRRADPGLRITVMTNPEFESFFRDVPGISFLHCDFGWRHKGLAGMSRLYRDVRACGITQFADLQDNRCTRILRGLLALSGRHVATIESAERDVKAQVRKFRKVIKPIKPLGERYAEVLRKLGHEPDLSVGCKAETRPVPPRIAKAAGEKQGVWVGFTPFSKYRGNIYPPHLSDKLVQLLSDRYQRVFIFGSGPYEKEFADYMADKYPNAVSVIGRLKAEAELDLISNLDVMVSMDSSSMHMAWLMGVPVVSIWGATHPFGGNYPPGQPLSGAVQIELPCRPCSADGSKPCMYKDYRCLRRIAPSSVLLKVVQTVEPVGLPEVAAK